MNVNSGPQSQQVGCTLNVVQILFHFSLYTTQTEQFKLADIDKNDPLFEILFFCITYCMFICNLYSLF